MKIAKRVLAFGLTAVIGLLPCQWKVRADTVWMEYDHAWCFSESSKASPEGAMVGEEHSFVYEYGVKGQFKPLTTWRSDWSAWTLNGEAPAVGGWFFSASGEADGAIAWTAPRTMNVEISSTTQVMVDALNAALCDGVGVMVLQQNAYGYAPLWPKSGSFAWYDVKAKGATTISGVRTRVRAGDRLLFVAHSLGAASDGDTVNITPKIQEITKKSDYPKGFFDWVDDRKNPPDAGSDTQNPGLASYNHGWAFGNSDKSNATGAMIDNASVFSYEYGKNGQFHLLNRYKGDWEAWTYNGEPPGVSGWYISANAGIDGAIVFTAPRDMQVDISSTMDLDVDAYQRDVCDGVGFMVLQQNSIGGFAPLWPARGSFQWYDVKAKGPAGLSDVKTYLKAGERILFVAHSTGTTTGDTVNVSPQITEISGGGTYPDGFLSWVVTDSPSSATPSLETYVSSWYLGEGGYNNNTEKNEYPFSYRYGFAGNYENYLPLKERYDWGNVWRIPDQWAPWIAGYFMSAARDVDGAVAFQAPETGTYEFSNNLGNVLKLSTEGGNESDGVQFLAVAQNESGNYYPVYPTKGSWEWLTLKKDQEYPFSPVTVSLKKNEKLLIITHSVGEEVNDTIAFDAKVALKERDSLSAYPASFEPWPEGFSDPDPNQNPAKLSDLFTTASPTIGPLSLQYGYDGAYKPMTLYREDWDAWTMGGNAPSIGSWYMGAVAKNDAVLVYTAPAQGQLRVKSESPLYLTWEGKSDGAQVMVVLKNKNGERPIWPRDGVWEWSKITDGMEVPMDGVSVFVEKEDQVHVIVRSVGTDEYDTVAVNPVFDLDTSVTEGKILEAVERVYPTEDDYINRLPGTKGTLDKAAGTGEKESAFPIWPILLCIGGAVLLAAGTTVILLRRKKRKEVTL